MLATACLPAASFNSVPSTINSHNGQVEEEKVEIETSTARIQQNINMELEQVEEGKVEIETSNVTSSIEEIASGTDPASDISMASLKVDSSPALIPFRIIGWSSTRSTFIILHPQMLFLLLFVKDTAHKNLEYQEYGVSERNYAYEKYYREYDQ